MSNKTFKCPIFKDKEIGRKVKRGRTIKIRYRRQRERVFPVLAAFNGSKV